MDFTLGEDRQMLVDTLGRFLSDRYPIATRHRIAGSEAGWDRETWRALADLGIVGALFDERSGGFGGGGFDIAAVFEPLGTALVVEPFLGTLMAGTALAQAGGQDGLLGEAIAGTTMLAFAAEEPRSRYDLAETATRAARDGESWRLTGTKAVVPQIEAADRIVVLARTSGTAGDELGLSLFLVEREAAGIDIRGYPLIDGGRGGELTFDETPAILLANEGDGLALAERAVAAGLVALAWEAIGVMDVLKTQTLDYLRTRKQFGVAIGKFQALQHRMATLAIEIEQARSAAINAAAALADERAVRERAASAAKATIDRVGTLVAEEAIQLHGGIGMTWELPLSHYAKRLTMIGQQLGDEDHHLERYIALGRTIAV